MRLRMKDKVTVDIAALKKELKQIENEWRFACDELQYDFDSCTVPIQHTKWYNGVCERGLAIQGLLYHLEQLGLIEGD
jgi:hypothetical protein